MIITIKTLQQKAFKIEIDDSKTVLDLKKKIEEEQGALLPASALKLIYSGKVLSNDAPISEYKVQENNFMVVMVSKTKPSKNPTGGSTAEAQETTTPSSGQSSTSQTVSSASETTQPQAPGATPSTTTPTSTPATPASTTTTPSSGSTLPPMPSVPAPTRTSHQTEGEESSAGDSESQASGSAVSAAATTLVTGQAYDEAVAGLMALGYEREQVVQALHASFNNPDRAAEILLQGGPQGPPPQDVSSPRPGVAQEEEPESLMEHLAEGQQQALEEPGDLSQAFNDPRVSRLVQQLRENPSALPAVLGMLQQTNPQLLSLIRDNQQAFIQMLNTSDSASGAPTGPQGAGQPGGAAPPEQGGGGSHVHIRVTPEEKEAIERLKALGFSEASAVQAYFACEKNEELAANFLFSEGDDQ